MLDNEPGAYFVYIIRCTDDSLYTGITTDLERRFSEHASRTGRSAKYTRCRKVQGFEAVWSASGRAQASRLEYRIKALSRAKKLLLIDGDIEGFDLCGCMRVTL